MSDAGARTHFDCWNFAPLDVAKGICHRTKEVVEADGAACDEFVLMPRCGNCGRFLPGDKPHLGACGAEQSRPMAYPALAAVTCEDYAPRESQP